MSSQTTAKMKPAAAHASLMVKSPQRRMEIQTPALLILSFSA